MFKKLIIGGIIILSISGCSKTEMITEIHEITSVNGNEIRGENITGKGEGIFYYENQFENVGIKDVNVGDKIKISWRSEDFYNENWNEFKAEKMD